MEEELVAPLGTFMEALPHWAFIVIHSLLIAAGFWLSRKTGNRGFLLFVLAEFSYITYHLGATHFLFAHIIAEVLDASALVTIAVGFLRRGVVAGGGGAVPGALQHG